MLRYNSSLNVLFLHWNIIKGKGSIDLANALSDNDKLLVFDSSFNSFGSCLNNESSKAWRKCFSNNKALIHIDLSHNSFKQADCEILCKFIFTYI